MRSIIERVDYSYSPEAVVERLMPAPGLAFLRSAPNESGQSRFRYLPARPRIIATGLDRSGSRNEDLGGHQLRFWLEQLSSSSNDANICSAANNSIGLEVDPITGPTWPLPPEYGGSAGIRSNLSREDFV